MDPIEEIFKNRKNNCNVENLQRLVLLQHQKVRLLKNAKELWKSYNLLDERNKLLINQVFKC